MIPLQSAGEERIRRFITSSEASPSMGTLRGQVFERLSLSTMCRAGIATLVIIIKSGLATGTASQWRIRHPIST
jgi:hypothetical protein